MAKSFWCNRWSEIFHQKTNSVLSKNWLHRIVKILGSSSWHHFSLFLTQKRPKSKKKKKRQHFPLFFIQKLQKNLRAVLVRVEVVPDWAIMMWMFPLAPTPVPLPSKAQTYWAFSPCQGWGRVGGKGEFGIGELITPPSTPLPLALFFRGRAKGRGLEGGPTMPRSSPPSPPPPHPRCQTSSCNCLAFLDAEVGGRAGTRDQRPPTHIILRLSNPHLPRSPPESPP